MTAPLSSVKKALKVLQAFTEDRTELGVTQIAELLKSHKSSVSRILMTLMAEGFVEKSPLTNKYRLGMKLVELGNRALSRFDLKDYASPYLEALAQKTNEIIHLSILDKSEILYIDKKGTGQVLTVATRIGGRNPAHACGMGKVLLSGLSQEELMKVLSTAPLKQFTPTTVTEVPRLLKEFEKIRRQGFAIDNEESFPGIKCVAAPITDGRGNVIAAMSATVPTQRMEKERMKELATMVTDCARQISEQIKIRR
jgi:IclR family transcriptional regulator, KDG regulon repressor